MQRPIPKFNLVELSTPILMTLWGLWFFLFPIAEKTAVFDKLKFMPSYFWAFVFFAIAIVKGYAVVYQHYRLRRFAAAISVALWLTVMTLFALGNYASHLVPSSMFFGFQSFMSWHRIGKFDKTTPAA